MKYAVKSNKLQTTILKLLSFVPAIAVMITIFLFSAQSATESTEVSNSVTLYVVDLIDDCFHLELTDSQRYHALEQTDHYIRKTAHFCEYAFLAFTIALPLYIYKVRGFFLVIVVGMICMIYASSDEIHQLFVPGRSGAVKDVILDSCGGVFGVYVTRIFSCFFKNTLFANFSK